MDLDMDKSKNYSHFHLLYHFIILLKEIVVCNQHTYIIYANRREIVELTIKSVLINYAITQESASISSLWIHNNYFKFIVRLFLLVVRSSVKRQCLISNNRSKIRCLCAIIYVNGST